MQAPSAIKVIVLLLMVVATVAVVAGLVALGP
jgi:hypothetical protein